MWDSKEQEKKKRRVDGDRGAKREQMKRSEKKGTGEIKRERTGGRGGGE